MTTQQLKNDLFSEREQEIIRAICQGGSNKDIAQKTNISLRTVETHKTNIFRKIGITNSVDLVLYAIKNGIVTI